MNTLMYPQALYTFDCIYKSMSEMRINRDKDGRTSVYIPSFLRDKFDLQNGDRVDFDTDGTNIIIKPIKKTAEKQEND